MKFWNDATPALSTMAEQAEWDKTEGFFTFIDDGSGLFDAEPAQGVAG